jgi:hypothetical protein
MATTVTARLPVAAFAAEPVENSTISYDPGVLESLRHAAQTAFDADTQPILGLLLGQRTPAGPSITAWLPAYSAGPNAATQGREPNLSRAVEIARMEYPGEYPIGWVRSKHQGEARLTTEELQTAGVISSPLAVVLRPSSQRPMRVASYLSVAGTPLVGERPFQEFFIHPNQASATPPLRARAVTLPPPAMAGAPIAGAPIAVRSGERFRDSVEGLRWAFPAGLLVLIAAAGLTISQVQSDDPVLPFTVSAQSLNPAPVKAAVAPLRVTGRQGQWAVHWDPRPAAGLSAVLEVSRDGNRESIVLSPEQYAAGDYLLPRHAGDLEVVLRTVREGATAEIRTRIVASATEPPPARTADRRLSVEVDRLKQELEAERNRRRLLLEMVKNQR